MNIVKGNILDLLNWWKEPTREYKYVGGTSYQVHRDKGPDFLCLLVGGSLNDKKYFKSIIDNHLILDNISGKDIGIMLFLNNDDSFIKWINSNRSDVAHLKGEIVNLDKFQVKNTTYNNKDSWVSRVTHLNIDSKVAEKILESTLSSFSQIKEYFNLSMRDLPCMILLDKELKNWIIHTREQESLTGFFKFLKEIASKVESVKASKQSYNRLRYFKFPESYQENIKEHTDLLQKAQEGKMIVLDEFSDFLKTHSDILSTDLEELIEGTSSKGLWDLLRGKERKSNLRKIEKYSNIFKSIKKEKEITILISKLIEADKAINEQKSKIQEFRFSYQMSVDSSQKMIENGNNILENLNQDIELHKQIDKICNSFERKYVIQKRTEPLRKFVQLLFGLTDKTKDILDIQEKMKKLME